MVIESIRITSFGCLRDYETSFNERLNVIEGHNESGKSTIAAFIKYMLYGFGRKNSEQAVSERRKYINWDTGRADGSMILSVDGRRYRIDRSTRLTGEEGDMANYSETLSVVDIEECRRLPAKIVPGEEFLGVPAEVFGNTAFIGQANVRLSERQMDQAIENLIFTGDEKLSTTRAAAILMTERDMILSENGEGILAEARERREQLKNKYAAADRQNTEILDREASLATARRNLNASVIEMNETVALNEACKKNSLIDRFEQMHAEEDRSAEFAAKIDSLRRRSGFNSFCPGDSYSTELRDSLAGFQSASRDMNSALAEYEAVAAADPLTEEEHRLLNLAGADTDERSTGEAHRRAMANHTAFSAVAALAFLLSAVAGALICFTMLPFTADATTLATLIIAIIALVTSAVMLALAVRTNKNLKELRGRFGAADRAEMEAVLAAVATAKAKEAEHESRVRSTSDSLIYARGRLDSSRGELVRRLGLWGRKLGDDDSRIPSIVEATAAAADRFVDEEARLKMYKATCDGKVRELRYSLRDQDEERLRREIPHELREELRDFDYSDLDRKIDFIGKRNESLRLRASQTAAAIAQLRISAEDVTELSDRLALADREVEELERRYNSLSMACQAIATSEERLRAEISPRLEEYSRHILDVATDGKYTTLGVSSKLAMTVGEDSRHIDYYSSGTRDIAYLSLRMALVDLLYRESPPICFDEVFSHQDEKRADDLMQAVVGMTGEGRQFFVFTCREREAAIALAAMPDCGRIFLK